MTRAGMDLAELRRLAEGAIPGPWKARTRIGDFRMVIEAGRQPVGVIENQHDAAYIAAANPATILRLLDELREANRYRRDLAESDLAASPDPEGPSDE